MATQRERISRAKAVSGFRYPAEENTNIRIALNNRGRRRHDRADLDVRRKSGSEFHVDTFDRTDRHRRTGAIQPPRDIGNRRFRGHGLGLDGIPEEKIPRRRKTGLPRGDKDATIPSSRPSRPTLQMAG